MVVAAANEGSGSISSLSGGGYTWTKVATTGLIGTQSAGQEAAIFAAEITTKPSAVTMACNNQGFRANAAFYSIINHSSITPVSTGASRIASGTNRSVTLSNLEDGDAMIAYMAHANVSSITWSGVTENFDTNTSENNSTFSSASDYKSGGSQGTQFISANFGGSAGYATLVAAAWR